MADEEQYEQEQEAEPQQEEYAEEAAAEEEQPQEAEAEVEQEVEAEAAYEEPAAEEPAYEEPEVKAEPEPVVQEEAEAYSGGLPQNVDDACKEIYSDNPGFNWFSTKLADQSLKTQGLTIDKVGTGGLNELVQTMNGEKDHIVFFLLRCDTSDDVGSARAKFVYGRFKGSGVKFMQKAKLTPNLGAFADQFQVKHLSKDADESMQDWTAEKLAKEFLRIGGAHKPKRYSFGPNAVYVVPDKK